MPRSTPCRRAQAWRGACSRGCRRRTPALRRARGRRKRGRGTSSRNQEWKNVACPCFPCTEERFSCEARQKAGRAHQDRRHGEREQEDVGDVRADVVAREGVDNPEEDACRERAVDATHAAYNRYQEPEDGELGAHLCAER